MTTLEKALRRKLPSNRRARRQKDGLILRAQVSPVHRDLTEEKRANGGR